MRCFGIKSLGWNHYSSMRTTHLETVCLKFQWPPPDVTLGVPKRISLTSLQKSPPHVTSRSPQGLMSGGGEGVSYLTFPGGLGTLACDLSYNAFDVTYPPPRPNKMTDICENITFPQLCWRAVKMNRNGSDTNRNGTFSDGVLDEGWAEVESHWVDQ